MAIEHLRRGGSVAEYSLTLENTLTAFNKRGTLLRKANATEQDPVKKADTTNRLQTLVVSRERLTTEITTLHTDREAGIFRLPDGQVLEGIPEDRMALLTLLPTAPSKAISPISLVLEANARELKDGTTNLHAAQKKSFAEMQLVQADLEPIGWSVASATPAEYGGTELEGEYRFYLRKNQTDEDSKKPGQAELEGLEGFSDAMFLFPHPTQDTYLAHATKRVDEYLETSREKVLREHQDDVMVKLGEHFKKGKRSGTIVLPPGAGKTHVAAEIARVLGVPTIVFSHSIDVLQKTEATLKALNPSATVTNFFGRGKNLSGDIINTLYQSFPSLLRHGADLEKFGLVIYDEADLALGEERHKMHALFPNAIKIALTATPYYEQLEGYEERGLVDKNDEWLETFRTTIHEMTLEEAFLRGAIPRQDFIMVRTNTVLSHVDLDAKGDYNPAKLARQLDRKSRNGLTIAMLAGVEHLPQGLHVSQRTIDEIKEIHERIKGKRTVVHGLGVRSIQRMEKDLIELGIDAVAVYGSMMGKRQDSIDEVRSGKKQILLGVDLTGRGLDIPELEVGIHMAPTLSSRKLLQQVGRLFRHSPETGKTKGISIQLVDTQADSSDQQPVLIPSILSPDFILRGRTSTKQPGTQRTGGKRGPAPISIEGSIDLDAYFEEVALQDIFTNKMKNASISEIHNAILEVYEKSLPLDTESLSLFDLYTKFAKGLPSQVTHDVNQKAIEAIASGVSNDVQMGLQILIAMNLKSILTAAGRYMNSDVDRNNDLLQEILVSVSYYAKESIRDGRGISSQFYRIAQNVGKRFISEEEGIPVGWVGGNDFEAILRETGTIFARNPYGLDEAAIDSYAADLSIKYAIPERTTSAFLKERNDRIMIPANQSDPTPKEAIRQATNGGIESALELISERERVVVEMRYFDDLTLDEISKEFGLTKERIRQIEAKALRKLRHRSRAKKIDLD